LGEKQVFDGDYLPFYFGFLPFFGICCVASHCATITSAPQTPPKKSHLKTYHRFFVFFPYGKIFIVRIENDMNGVEGEEVARKGNNNREWTPMDANSWERDRLGRHGVGLAPRLQNRSRNEGVLGKDAKHGGRSVCVAVRRDKDDRAARGSDFGAFASIRVRWRFGFQITQVVDFPSGFT
jgi:hypothetical protein